MLFFSSRFLLLVLCFLIRIDGSGIKVASDLAVPSDAAATTLHSGELGDGGETLPFGHLRRRATP